MQITKITELVGKRHIDLFDTSSISFMQGLSEEGTYTDLANGEEGNLYQIVLASTSRLARIRSYLRQYVGKADPLDMDAYRDWIKKLYDEWPIPGETLSNGRIRKKNAGEVSITIKL